MIWRDRQDLPVRRPRPRGIARPVCLVAVTQQRVDPLCQLTAHADRQARLLTAHRRAIDHVLARRAPLLSEPVPFGTRMAFASGLDQRA